MTVLSAALLIFLVLDPLGNIPFFISALKNAPPERHKYIIVREMLFALAILMIFLLAGPKLLALLQISESSLTAAGGVILLLIAIKMVFPSHDLEENTKDKEPFIVPLAIPYTAGPSAISTVMLMSGSPSGNMGLWMLSLFLAWAAAGIILFFADRIKDLFGEKGITAMERLMGLILSAAAIQMLMNGIANYVAGRFPGLTH